MANHAVDTNAWELNRVRMCKYLHPLCCHEKMKRIAVTLFVLRAEGGTRTTQLKQWPISVGNPLPRCQANITVAASRPLSSTRKFALPRAFLWTPPPDQPHRGRALFFAQSALGVAQERRLIGIITSPLVAHEKSIRQLVIESDGVFFQRLCDPAEEAAAVGQILRSSGQGQLGRKLVAQIPGAAVYMRRS